MSDVLANAQIPFLKKHGPMLQKDPPMLTLCSPIVLKTATLGKSPLAIMTPYV